MTLLLINIHRPVGRILTLDNLRKMHVIVMEWCYMCRESRESVNHLMLHSKVARGSWELGFRLFRIEWVMLFRVAKLLASWRSQFGSHHNLKARRMAPHSLIWCIRREWNYRNFEDCERKVIELKNIMFKTLLRVDGCYHQCSLF
jgi:hypothetical protein